MFITTVPTDIGSRGILLVVRENCLAFICFSAVALCNCYITFQPKFDCCLFGQVHPVVAVVCKICNRIILNMVGDSHVKKILDMVRESHGKVEDFISEDKVVLENLV